MILTAGESATIEIELTPDHVTRFVALSGDDAPLHVDAAFAMSRGFSGCVVHGALLAALVSRFVGGTLPGPEAVLERMDLAFRTPCYAPCTVIVEGRVRQVSEAVASVILDVSVRNRSGETYVTGKTWHKLLPKESAS